MKNRWLFVLVCVLFFTRPVFSATVDNIPKYLSQDPEGDLRLEMLLGQSNVFPNQKLLIAYQLLARYAVRFESVSPEKSQKFWFKYCENVPSKLPFAVVARDNKRFTSAIVSKKFFFPMEPGTFNIYPGDVLLSFYEQAADALDDEGKTPHKVRLGAPPVKITVQPFPEPMPENFTGSTGEFTIATAAENPKPKNGIYLFNVTVKGEGNLWAVQLSPPDFSADFELLSVEESVKDSGLWEDEAVVGEKTFHYQLAAKRKGHLVFPGFSFVYFDPITKSYKTTVSQPIAVESDMPQNRVRSPQRVNSGLAVAIDFSGSMLSKDIGDNSRSATAKKIAESLLLSSKAESFVIVRFAEEIQKKEGLPRDRDELIAFIKEDKPLLEGTSTGDAVQAALKSLKSLVRDDGIKHLVIIGDGITNNGHVSPVDLAPTAFREGVTIFALGIGNTGIVPYPAKGSVWSKDSFVQTDVGFNGQELEETAKVTNGKYFHIKQPKDLESALSELNNNLLFVTGPGPTGKGKS